MKKITTLFTTLLFIGAIVLSNQLKAQSSCAWAKRAGGNDEDLGKAVATDKNGNVYYVGDFYSATVTFGTTTLHNPSVIAGGYGVAMFLVKYDSCGNFIWATEAGGGNDVIGTGVATDASGNVYVSGYQDCDTAHFGSVLLLGNYYNAFLVKYNSSGVAQWAKQGAGNYNAKARAVTVDAANNVYITGYYSCDTLRFGSTVLYNSYSGNSYDIFTAKFDNNGNIQWLKGGRGDSDDLAYGIGTDAAGNVYVAGAFSSTYVRFDADSLPLNGYNDIFITKYNANGVEQWLRTAGDSEDDEALGLATDAAGNSYITGYIAYTSTVSFGAHTVVNNTYGYDMFIAKYDANGTNQWAQISKQDMNSYNSQGESVSLDAAGNPSVIGYFTSDSLKFGGATIYNTSLAGGGGDSVNDIFVVKYKAATGYASWARNAGGVSHDFGYGIANGPNNSLYITGEFSSSSISVAGITCTLTPGSITETGDAFIANNISTSPISPEICLVSADSIVGANQYNVVYWDKTQYPTASKFIILREVTTGVYGVIGSQPYNKLSLFVDTARHIGSSTGNGGDPNGSTYRYKLQILDTSGTYSYMGPYHNTVFFINAGGGTFTWNTYDVENLTLTPVQTFSLSRDDNSTGVWNVVQTTAGTQKTLSDPNYSTYQTTASWRVDGGPFNCTPTLRLAGGNNSVDVARVKSHSNQNNNRQNAIKQIVNNNSVSIYPNPNKGSFTIETTATEKQTVQVVDVNGKLVFSQSINGNTSIDANNLSDGVYNVSIIGSNGVANKRLVIVK